MTEDKNKALVDEIIKEVQQFKNIIETEIYSLEHFRELNSYLFLDGGESGKFQMIYKLEKKLRSMKHFIEERIIDNDEY